MKKILLFLTTLIMIGGFVSCKKELKYSCDKQINQFVTQNLQTLQVISRDSLAQLPIDMQFGIFNGLSNKIN